MAKRLTQRERAANARERGRKLVAAARVKAKRLVEAAKARAAKLIATSRQRAQAFVTKAGTKAAPKKQNKLSTKSGKIRNMPAVDRITILAAYDRLTAKAKSPNVLISDLQSETGLGLRLLKPWLLAESEAHRALPLLGEPSLATPKERAASLDIEGKPHMYIRFLTQAKPKK